MSVELIKYAFIAGELSPTLYGRTDLTKYDLGLALAYNWFVDYRGGISTRPGTEFSEYIWRDTLPTKFFSFQFSADLANTYVLLFGHEYIRFLQDGAYVVEPPRAIVGVSKASPAVITMNSPHNFTNGNWVKVRDVQGMTELNGRTFQIVVVDATRFSLIDAGTLANVNSTSYETYTGGGIVERIYTVTSPYTSDDLEKLDVQQNRDLLRITHPDHPIRNLIRNDHTDWELELEQIGNNKQAPSSISLTGSGSGNASVMYAVSAVYRDGTESLISTPVRIKDTENFTATEGWVRVKWQPVPDAVEYIIYRSNVVNGPINAGEQLGYLGKSKGTFFTDTNIIPDFTKSPYDDYDPFAPGAIDTVEITNGGTGYEFLAPVTITGGGGSGFRGYAVADTGGVLTSIVIQRRGQNYSAPLTVTIGGSGSGATATATVGPTEGLYPSISAIFQQRQVYAASYTQPLTIWASKISNYSIFDTAGSVTDRDSYEFEIDSAEVNPITHMFSMRGGLLLMSLTGIWLLTGGASGGAVTPSNALADPQSATGVSAVRPVKVGTDLLYIEGKGYSVRLLSYNDFSKVYSGEDKSILSNHLFNKDKQIVRWAFAENPYKIVWATRSDGALLAFTIVKEQDVYAWTWGQTKGLFRDIISVAEDGIDRVYLTVERLVAGRWRKYVERLAIRDFINVEDAWAVDSGLRYEPPAQSTTLNISPEVVVEDRGFVTLTAGASLFTGKEEWFVRGAGGIFVIKEVISGTVAEAVVIESAKAVLPEDGQHRVLEVKAGNWSLGEPFTSFGGLWHLEGEEVQVFGDGNVFPPQTVNRGRITIPDAATKVLVGLKFRPVARTLPPTVTDVPIEARRKRVVGVAVRLHESRGLKIGREEDDLYPIKERTNELWGAPIIPINGYRYQILPTNWDEDAQTFFVQEDPLPVTILGLVPDLEIGDDTD